MNAATKQSAQVTQQQFDATEYVVTVLESGCVVYHEQDTLVLDFGFDSY